MIVIFRFGPNIDRYAIIVQRPFPNGDVELRWRESSSSGRNSDLNEVFLGHVSELRLGEPRRKDTVVVLHGAHRGFVGKVKVVLDRDLVLVDLPGVVLKLSQVAWLHTR
jgi:hypothetical protein